MLIDDIPGVGKTTLVKNLLVDLWARQQTPFVVLEAAKKEYNALLGQIPSLMVYTSGADGPLLRINPLRPEDGTLIENHAAAVTLALTASTGAEHPIPEAFSGLLQQTYHRFGWEYGMAAYTDPAKPSRPLPMCWPGWRTMSPTTPAMGLRCART